MGMQLNIHSQKEQGDNSLLAPSDAAALPEDVIKVLQETTPHSDLEKTIQNTVTAPQESGFLSQSESELEIERLSNLLVSQPKTVIDVLYMGLIAGLIISLSMMCYTITQESSGLQMFLWAGLSILDFLLICPVGQNRWIRRRGLLTQTKPSIGLLCDALHCGNPLLEAYAAELLTLWLPSMKESEAKQLCHRQRDCLYQELVAFRTRGFTKLQTAIIEVLPTFADALAVPLLQGIIERSAWSPQQRKAQRQAMNILNKVQLRLESRQTEQSAQTVTPQENGIKAVETVKLVIDPKMDRRQASANLTVRTQLSELEDENKRNLPAMRLTALAANYVIILPYCIYTSATQFYSGNWIAGSLFAGLAAGSTQLHRLTLSSKQCKLARKLAQSNEVAGIGPLAEVLDWPEPEMKDIAATALTRLLPKVKASDSVLLDDRQRNCLYRSLTLKNASLYSEFIIAILNALQQIGDASALPYVERLAEIDFPDSKRFSHLRRVRNAAKDCLPFLRELATQEQQSSQLLRPSSALDVGVSGETLLRPAAFTASEPEQLLRASSAEVEEPY